MRGLTILTVLALGGLFVAGCGQGGFSKRASEGKENVFRYPIVTNPTTLDPGLVRDGDTIDLLQQVYEGLVTWSEQNEVVPLLAESWTLEDGGRSYVFKIKQGVKFHNGQELKAADFKWTWERNCDPKLKSPTADQYMSEIVGVQDVVDGRAKEISGVKVLDDYTLKVTIDKPRPYFLGKMTYAVYFVLPSGSVSAQEEISKTDQMIGTGAFKAASFIPEQLFVLNANPDYHGGAPKVDRVERPVIKDPVTRLNKYKNGEVDLVMLERQDIPAIEKDGALKDHLVFFDRPSIYYVGMAPKKYAPFKDVRVRQAFAMAVDRDFIVNKALGGINHIANSIVPKGVMGYRESAKPLPHDPVRAKALLAEAGFPGGKGLPPIELTYREDRPDIRIVAEAVATQLKETLGVNVTQKTMEWRAFLERQDAGDLQFVHMRWAADYLDPQNFLSFMLATYPYGPENKLGYSNPTFDALVKRADEELDKDKRLAIYAEAEDLVLKDGPWIPIYFQRDAELINPKVKGLRESLFGHLPHTTVELVQKP